MDKPTRWLIIGQNVSIEKDPYNGDTLPFDEAERRINAFDGLIKSLEDQINAVEMATTWLCFHGVKSPQLNSCIKTLEEISERGREKLEALKAAEGKES